ncbi:unnamed protein product [Phytomonas sp. Hart1]|nr:unnamed protein product [Phytomonas sp. Hart1]|eukprot:CCW69598.1 unnamed protein product [Phytomonas sp. isolate Hart1]
MSDVKTIHASQVPISQCQTLAVSGFAGMFAWCFAHPFEMWKNTLMTAPEGKDGQMAAFKATARKGFYRGLSSGLGRQVVYTTGRLGFYPSFRDTLLKAEVGLGIKASADPSKANILDRALAGAGAGVFASFLSSPVEVCMVLQTTTQSKAKMSLFNAAGRIWSASGFMGFWLGFGALGSRAALVGVAQVAVHDQILTKLRGRNRERKIPFNDNIVVNVASVLTALIYGFVTMPVELARVRMSMEAKLQAGVERRYTNTIQCITKTLRDEGFWSMYSSFLPYFSRAALHTVICFFVLEYMTRQLKTAKAEAAGYKLVQ